MRKFVFDASTLRYAIQAYDRVGLKEDKTPDMHILCTNDSDEPVANFWWDGRTGRLKAYSRILRRGIKAGVAMSPGNAEKMAKEDLVALGISDSKQEWRLEEPPVWLPNHSWNVCLESKNQWVSLQIHSVSGELLNFKSLDSLAQAPRALPMPKPAVTTNSKEKFQHRIEVVNYAL